MKISDQVVVFSPQADDFDGVYKYSKALANAIDGKFISADMELPGKISNAAFIHNISNNESIVSVLNNLVSYPGIVILHDLFISYRNNSGHSEITEYLESASLKFDSNGNLVPAIAKLSSSIIVHTLTARNTLVKLGVPSNKIAIIAHPFLENPESKWVKTKKSTFVVSTFGHLSLQKDYESLFELAQILGQRLRLQITLQVVGPKYREAQNAIALLSRRYRGVKLQFHSNLSDIEFSDFMLKTDLAIQLRSNWMGEASGVLAQLVVRGVPVITNMDSYSEFRNCHIMNSQSHKEDLFRFIDRISNLNIGESIFDPSQSDVFALDHWSEKMILAAETFRSQVLSNALLIESFKLPEEFIDEQIISRAWNKIFPPLGINIASDVSQLWRETQFSGIQRSTVELHRAILRESDKRQGDLSLSPIDLSSNRNPFTLEIQSLDPLGEYGQLDQSHLSHLLLLQPNYDLVKDNSRLVQIASNGVKVISQIHDLLPITAPSYFHSDFTKEVFLPWIKLVVHVSNKIIVSTSSVLAELEAFASSAEITLPAVEIIPLASFFPTINSRPQTRTRNKFVMVGTIEPRKGHEEVLDVFEIIWSNRGESELHIVGQVGWMMDTFLSRVKRHPQLNNKLFMHGRLTDKELQSHLVTSQACIFASQGEGFGLPIVEAASLGTPLILRDIPVFREVSGNNATFFKDSRDLYLLIHGIDRGSFTPKPSIPPTWTWDEAAVKLLEFVLS